MQVLKVDKGSHLLGNCILKLAVTHNQILFSVCMLIFTNQLEIVEGFSAELVFHSDQLGFAGNKCQYLTHIFRMCFMLINMVLQEITENIRQLLFLKWFYYESVNVKIHMGNVYSVINMVSSCNKRKGLVSQLLNH